MTNSNQQPAFDDRTFSLRTTGNAKSKVNITGLSRAAADAIALKLVDVGYTDINITREQSADPQKAKAATP